jgi:error-prone DNA polymerase
MGSSAVHPQPEACAMYLNCHSYFSFHYGTLSQEQLLAEAQSKGVSSFALTDINNTSGCLDFVRKATKYGIKPVIGIDFRNGSRQEYTCIAKNNEGFYELNLFLSKCLVSGQISVPEKPPIFSQVHVIYPYGKADPEALLENEFIGIKPGELNKILFGKWTGVHHRLVAFAPVTFLDKKGFNAHRLLRAIGNNTLLSKLNPSEQADEGEVMNSEEVLKKQYEYFPDLLANTRKLLDNCSIDFEFGINKNKKYLENAEADYLKLERLSELGLKERYGVADVQRTERLGKELKLIRELGFVSYFLINYDMLVYARSRGYFYVGRGSGANSIVAYCLRITDVDPIDLDLYFERFINPFRTNPPDFDIDFSWKDRGDVLDYLFKKFGQHIALLATYATFQQKSVLRELGKVFGLPKDEIDALVSERKKPQTSDHIVELILKYSHYIHDFPSHLSIHAGGVLISEKPIAWYSALNIPAKGFPLVQFSMLEAEDAGLYKFDILSQRGLGHIKETVEVIKENRGIDIDIHDLKKFKEDDGIRDLLKTGKTMGCFYVESPAMRMLLKKLEATTYIHLVAASSIIRPGVASSGMMREYILRFRDSSRRTYVHPKIGVLLEETYGIMVYQEDVMKVAHHFAGLTLAEADVLRRGMSGKFRGREEFLKAKEKFFLNCNEFGYEPETTAEVWRQIESFAGYSFSKGHSASYAVESYQSLFLKAHFPKEFMVGVINNFGGFYQTEYYIHEARMSGALVHPPCVNHSHYKTCIAGENIYLGFIHLPEIHEGQIAMMLNERERGGPFQNLEDFSMRISPSIGHLRILIRIGAFSFTGKTKKALLWEIHMILGRNQQTSPSRDLFAEPVKKFVLPDLSQSAYDDAIDEIELLGFPLCPPFSLLGEKELKKAGAQKDLLHQTGKGIEITGYLVTYKNTRTKHGDSMYFGTFLDQHGFFFDTIHFPDTAERYPFTGKGCYRICGKVTEDFGYPSIEVGMLKKLPYTCIEQK